MAILKNGIEKASIMLNVEYIMDSKFEVYMTAVDICENVSITSRKHSSQVAFYIKNHNKNLPIKK